MHVVACESQESQKITLFLVDRKIYKDRWWSTSLHRAVIFKKKEAAEAQAAKLKLNNPRAMTYVNALKAELENESWVEVHDVGEEGWDGHKDWL